MLIDSLLVQNTLALAALLIAVGLVGFVARRNAAVMIVSLAIMSQGVMLIAVGFGTLHGNLRGQALAAFVLALTGVEIACLIAVAAHLALSRNTLDPIAWNELGEAPAEDDDRPVLDANRVEPAPNESANPARPAAEVTAARETLPPPGA